MSFALRPFGVHGTRRFALRRVAGPEGPGAGITATPIDGVLPATPIKFGEPGAGGSTGYQERAVRWTSLSWSMNESSSIQVSAQISQGIAHLLILPIIVEATSGPNTASPSDITITNPLNVYGYMTFLPGQTIAEVTVNAGAIAAPPGEFRELTLTLDTSGYEAVFGEHTTVNVVHDPGYGPVTAGLFINETSAPPAVPEWTWAPPLVSSPATFAIDEGFGVLQPAIVLTAPAIADTVFNITLTDITTVPGPPPVDVELLTPQVTIPAGQTTVRARLNILNNPDFVPTFRTCDITAAAVNPAHAVPAVNAVETWRLQINNTTQVGPVVEMASNTAQAVEGGAGVQIMGQLQLGTLSSALDVLIDVGLAAGVEPSDYNIVWASGQPNRARINPGVSSFPICTIYALEDGFGPELGETITLTIASFPSPLIAGGQLSTVVTLVDSGSTLPTEASVQITTGLSTNVIQGLMAVNPPSPTLPVYMVDNGSGVKTRAQVVGMVRDGDENWVSCYVYAVVARDTLSVPHGTAAAISISLADGTETNPTPTFNAEPMVTYRLQPANCASIYEREANGDAFPSGANVITGPDQTLGWDQVGADIVRETQNTAWLANTGVAFQIDGNIIAGAGSPDDRCGMIDSVTTMFSGLDLVIVSGSFHNGAWNNTDNFEDPAFTTRTSAGVIHWRTFEAEIPAGWTPVIIDAHPFMSVAGQVITFVPDRSALDPSDVAYDCDQYMPTGGEYQFRFAMIKTVGGNVNATQAQRYLERRTIATWIGPLGVTHNAIFGDGEHYLLDLHAVGFQLSGSPNSTASSAWQRVIQASDLIAGTTNGMVDAWTNGTRLTAVGLNFARLPNSTSLVDDPSGWAHPACEQQLGPPGGLLQDQSWGFLPCAGWWRRSDLQRMAMSNRQRLRMQLPFAPQQGNAWWWQCSSAGVGAQSGQRVMTFQTAAVVHQSLFRPPWFYSDYDQAHAPVSNPDGGYLSLYMRAPTTRPWNVPTSPGQADPATAILSGSFPGYGTFQLSHVNKYRNIINDGWWGCREHMARRMHEAVAAYASRAYAPVAQRRNTSNQPLYLIKAFTHSQYHVGDMIPYLTGGSQLGKYSLAPGFNGSGTYGPFTLGNHRIESWTLMMVMGYFASGTNTERSRLRGQDSSVGANVPWWSAFITWLNWNMTATGFVGRWYTTQSSDDIFDPAKFGPTDEVQRIGAWRGDPNPTTPGSPDRCTGQQGFYQSYFTHAVTRWRRCMPTAQTSLLTLLDRVYDYHINYLAGVEAWSAILGYPFARGGEKWPKWHVASISGGPPGNVSVALSGAPLTVAEQRAGGGHWRFLPVVSEATSYDQTWKLLSCLWDAYRVTGNTQLLNVACSLYEQPAWPNEIVDSAGNIDQDAVNEMFYALLRTPGDGWEARVASSTNIAANYQSVVTWWYPFMALLQRQFGATVP